MTRKQPLTANLVVESESTKLLAIDAFACELLEVSALQVVGLPVQDLLPGVHTDRWRKQLDQNENQPIEMCVSLGASKSQDLSQQQARLQITPLDGANSRWLLLALLPLRESDAEAIYLDALTGIPDRRELQHRYELLRRRSQTAHQQLAVVFMDLDRFKQVNDKFGHAVGDSVLVALTQRWTQCIREGDLVARYGGDEFVILLLDIGSRQEAQPVLHRITQTTEEPITVGPHEVCVGVTLGLAIADESTGDLQQLLTLADKEMYAIKKSRA